MTDKPNIEQSASRSRDFLSVRELVLTYVKMIILCILVAVFFSLVNMSKSAFLPSMILGLCFAFTGYHLIILLYWLIKPEEEDKLLIALIWIVCLVVGTVIGLKLFGFIMTYLFHKAVPSKPFSFGSFVFNLGICGAVGYFFYSRVRLQSVREAAEKERISRFASEKAVIESNLRLLQAQIEPHFLFNTLSNILSLIDTEPSKGKSMLMDLTSYLRTSLSRTLPEATTLGQEIEAVKAYLNIQKIRLGDRLHFTVNVPETLTQHPFPPMLLQPLVENAVKHGLEPDEKGGEISIKVQEEAESIRIEVVDTGLGFTSFNIPGVGIANVRERVKMIYGEKGRFIMQENKPDGLRAVIEVPKHDL